MAYLMDLHVYTNNTAGANDKISFLCEKAAEKELRAVAFTDVLNIDECGGDLYGLRRRTRHSFFDIAKARMMYFGAVSVFAGVELRQALCDPSLAADTVAAQEYDIVLTRLTRWAPDAPFGLGPDIPQGDFNAFAERYADTLIRTVDETDFDVLSGLLAPLRETRVYYDRFEACAHGVLEALVRRGKALEVNTKDVLGSERIRDLYFRLISFYKEAGGEYLTFGSESFSHDELGAGIELSMSAVKRAGFQRLTFYDKRIPYLVSL